MQNISKKDQLYFLRLFRNSGSELWLIDFNDERIGKVHLHFKKNVLCDIILWKKVSPKQLQIILDSLNEWLVESVEEREDFIFSVYQGKEVASYSDTVDHDLYAPTRKDLREHGVLLNRVLSKFQDARGKLHEHVVKEFYTKIGFQSVKACARFDALKVDVIAEDEERIVYCQVKLGKVDNRAIYAICESIASIDEKKGKKKVIAIVADSFPTTIELLKENLEEKFKARIWTILKSQILTEFPEYKRTL